METINNNAECRNKEASIWESSQPRCLSEGQSDGTPHTRSVRQFLPYAGIPVVCVAMLFRLTGGADVFAILKLELIVLLGYITATIDITTKRVPNGLVLVMLAAWVSIMAPKLFLDTETAIVLLKDSALGLSIGGGLFLLVYITSRKGLGGGDVKFMAAAGLYLGFGAVLSVILFGSILAALAGLMLLVIKKIGRKDKIPLVPFLYAGILITVFLGVA